MGRILAALDFRFAEPKIEHLYYNYYAQVKRNLLPTAIQVVLLVNLLQLLSTCLHLYLAGISTNQQQQQQQQQQQPLYNSNSNDDLASRSTLVSAILPLVLQFIVLVATCAMLKLVRKELQLKHRSVGRQPRRPTSLEDGNLPSSDEQLGSDEDAESSGSDKSYDDGQADPFKRKSAHSTSLSASLSLSMEPQIIKRHRSESSSSSSTSSSTSSSSSDERDQEEEEGLGTKSNELELKSQVNSTAATTTCNQENLGLNRSSSKRHKRRRHKHHKYRKSKANRLSRYKLSLPYILWLCQLLQLASGLPPAHSFISYASLLLYSYTIYVIFPIRLMNCVLLALALLASLAILDYLLLFTLLSTTSTATTTSIPQLSTHFSKLVAFMMLALATNIIGVMSFFFYERQQRVAFLETRQSLETKLILEQESREQERLLLSILPRHLANDIRKDLGEVVTRQFKKIYMSRHENVSILFADIVGFTAISSNCPAAELVRTLNELFARFDKLAEKYHQLRIKILGDCYYAISGAPIERPDHAVLCVHMGLSMVEAIKSVRERTKSTVDMRVGVHTGGVLAGVLGQRQWQFDVYSKDVELANKMESSGLPGRVHISNATLRFLNDEFELSDGDGHKREEALRLANIRTYFIDRVKKPYPEGTLDALTCQPQQQQQQQLSSQEGQPLARTSDHPTAVKSKQQLKLVSYSSDPKTGKKHQKQDDNKQQLTKVGGVRRSRQIKRLSLNFSNRQLERQFRSTSDIASCISLLGLPVALLCAACAHLSLYGFRLQLALAYSGAEFVLLLGLLLCVLPYLWRDAGSSSSSRVTRTKSNEMALAPPSSLSSQPRARFCGWLDLVGVAETVKQRAWMKLALTSWMTLIWLLAHGYAIMLTAEWAGERQLSNSRDLQLFSLELFNYFAIVCSLAITAVTRISFLVKTAIILIVIILQVIMNLSLLSSSSSSNRGSIISPNFNSDDDVVVNSSKSNSNLHPFEEQYVFALTLATLCWALFLINRQFELTNRRLFLWRKQVEQRKEKVADMRKKNEALVYNILPPNVAKIFLGKRHINDEELYSKSYEAVGVLFAAMPNFSDFYTEESVNNQGLECLRFLNEVISDYDALLDQPRFKNIIKIKTMGSTYMAASGLYEGDAREEAAAAATGGQTTLADSSLVASESSSSSPGNTNSELELCRAKWGHLEQLTEFALALKDTLNNINKDSFNNFVLRIGINQGPITAGVIGVKKPHFDMWGNTVNVASRMESTGRAGSIQVVEETASILRNFGFQFDQRGLVSVKGKGKLMTFYLTGRHKEEPFPSSQIAAVSSQKVEQTQQQPQRASSSAASNDRLIFITPAKPEPASDGTASIHLV